MSSTARSTTWDPLDVFTPEDKGIIAAWRNILARLLTIPTELRLDILKMLLIASKSVHVEKGYRFLVNRQGDRDGSTSGFLDISISVVNLSSQLLGVCYELYDEGVQVIDSASTFDFSGHRLDRSHPSYDCRSDLRLPSGPTPLPPVKLDFRLLHYESLKQALSSVKVLKLDADEVRFLRGKEIDGTARDGWHRRPEYVLRYAGMRLLPT